MATSNEYGKLAEKCFAANFAASPSSIGPDACAVKWSRQLKSIANVKDCRASLKAKGGGRCYKQ
jgi:hypothetical protein